MIELGKYAFIVLASYAACIGLIGSLIAISIQRQRRIRSQISAIGEKSR